MLTRSVGPRDTDAVEDAPPRIEAVMATPLADSAASAALKAEDDDDDDNDDEPARFSA